MKNSKKLIMVLVSMLMLVTMIAGCGQKIEPPELVAEAYYDLIVYGDTSKLETMGFAADDVNTIKEQRESQVKTTILKLLPNLLRLLRHQVIQKVQTATFFQSWRLSLQPLQV